MSELPSRKETAYILGSPAFDMTIDEFADAAVAALRGIASGQLVDRQAIDTVWLCVEKSNDTAEWRVSNQPGSPTFCYFSGGAHTPWCGVAALGIGDNDE